jgi:6,7-dimethyl-8-ribityllumazine synthase
MSSNRRRRAPDRSLAAEFAPSLADMNPRRIASNTNGLGRRVGIVLSRFNPGIGDLLLAGALRAIKEAGVVERNVTIASVPGALETPLALQRFAQSGDYDALVALGAVIRGETYHFEIVANESARGVAEVQLEFGIPIGNGILTTDTDEQALVRCEQKGFEAAQAALELANLLEAIDGE